MADIEQARQWCDGAREILKTKKAKTAPVSDMAAELAAFAALNKGGVNHAKLLLRWRDAQASAAASLATLGQQLLALPEVQADPRLAQVRRAAAGLPALIPTFGDALADHLDAAANAGNSGPGAADSRAAALATIGAYRKQLSAVPVLARLQAFASKNLKAELPIADALDAALAAMAAELAAAR